MTEPTFLSMTDEDYFGTYALSSSGLRCFASEGSWLYYHQYVTKTVERNYSDALRIGHAIHQAVELGDSWTDLVYTQPETIQDDDAYQAVMDEAAKEPANFSPGSDINKRSKYHRSYLEHHNTIYNTGDMLRLSPAEIADTEQQRLAISDNPACLELIEAEGLREAACFREDEKTGALMKCKVDKIVGRSVIDLKSTRKTVPSQFVEQAVGRNGRGGLGYHYQAEWYLRVTKLDEFKIIVVTKTKAPEAFLFTMPEWLLEQARDANDNHAWSIVNCHRIDSWHCTGHGTDLPLDPQERIPL